jgi:MYND finger
MNLETLSACRKIWSHYMAFCEPGDDHPKIVTQVKQVCSKYMEHWHIPRDAPPKVHLPSLTASFGTSIGRADLITLYHMNQYWTRGVTDVNDEPNQPFVNPLFVYTQIAHDKFILERDTTPLTIFHLRGAGEHCERMGIVSHNLAKVVASAKQQFQDWCEAFREFVGDPRDPRDEGPKGKLVIRFAAADPITFCLDLQKSLPDSIFKNYAGLSSMWSGVPIVINDEDRIAQFNTIDTASLIDDVGCINLLLATVPLLHTGPATTLTTTSYGRPFTEETKLLDHYLCGHKIFMYHVFGVAPLAYVTCTSPIGLLQDTAGISSPFGAGPECVISQIVWKFPWSGDSVSNVRKPTKVSMAATELNDIILKVFLRMLKDPDALRLDDTVSADYYRRVYRRRYNAVSYAAFLAFAKRRIDGDWDTILKKSHHFWEYDLETQFQLHLFGVYTFPQFVDEMRQAADSARASYRHDPSFDNPLGLKYVVLTVPSKSLRGMYNDLRQRSGKYNLDICYYQGERSETPYRQGHSNIRYDRVNHVSCFVPISGKLSISGDDKTGRIIESECVQWGGHLNDEREDFPDLHLVFYLPAALIPVFTNPKEEDHIIRFGWDPERHTRDDFGNGHRRRNRGFEASHPFDLKAIFKTTFTDAQHVHFLESIEGFETPILANADTKKPPSNGRRLPVLSTKDANPAYWLRLPLPSHPGGGSAGGPLFFPFHTGVESSCAVSVDYKSNSFEVQFPFPVTVNPSTHRHNKQGPDWLDVHIPLSTADWFVGGYANNPFALGLDSDTGAICSWNLPIVNFANLPVVGTSASPGRTELNMFYSQMISDRDIAGTGNTELRIFRDNFATLLQNLGSTPRIPGVFAISSKNVVRYYFFVTDVYMDDATHSIAVEAFMYEPTPEQRAKRAQKLIKNLDVKVYTVSEIQSEYWQRMIPSLVERCRDWEHRERCEYRQGIELGKLCTCGKGRPNAKFTAKEEWSEFASNVTRCAISPIFAAPFIEETRDGTLDFLGVMRGTPLVGTGPVDPKSCAVCTSTRDPKKCARCGEIYYCGKECQKADWKRHKGECRTATSSF